MRAYGVYVYLDGDNRTYDRPATYRLTAPDGSSATIRAVDAAGKNFSTTFTRADNSSGNYVKFSVNGGAFTLSATPEPGDGTRRAPVNAIEIATDRVWLRDSAPTGVLDDAGRVVLLNWAFNGWAKVQDNYTLDEQIGREIARRTGLPRIEPMRAGRQRVVLEAAASR